MEGYLWKAGELNKGWKERFFSIDPKVSSKLTYTKNKGQKPLGSIELKGAKVVMMPPGCEQRSGLLVGITPPSAKRTYLVETPNEAERSRWLRAMLAQGAISGGTVDGVGEKSDIDTAQTPLKSGFLGKIGEKRKTRKIRYFVLYRQYLTYWESPTVKKLLGRIPLYADSIAEKANIKDEPWAFTLQESPNRRKYILLAQNERDREEWLWALQISTESKKDERYTPKSLIRKGLDTTTLDPLDELAPDGGDERRESEALFFQSKDSDFESEEELEDYEELAKIDTTKVLAQFQNILVNDCSGSMQAFREAVGQFLIQQEELQSAKAREARANPEED